MQVIGTQFVCLFKGNAITYHELLTQLRRRNQGLAQQLNSLILVQ